MVDNDPDTFAMTRDGQAGTFTWREKGIRRQFWDGTWTPDDGGPAVDLNEHSDNRSFVRQRRPARLLRGAQRILPRTMRYKRRPNRARRRAVRFALEQRLLPHVVVIGVGIGEDENAIRDAQGTGTLVERGGRRLLITADHVVEAFFDGDSPKPDRRAMLSGFTRGSIAWLTNWRVVGRDRELDVAVLEAPSEFEPTSIQRSFAKFTEGELLRADDQVVFIGAPGAFRDPVAATFRFRPHAVRVGDCSSSSPRLRMELDGYHADPAGISGAGLFKIEASGALRFAGIVCGETGAVAGAGVAGALGPAAGRAAFAGVRLNGLLLSDGEIDRDWRAKQWPC